MVTLLWQLATTRWRAGCAERCTSGSERRGWEIVNYAQSLTLLRTKNGWLYLTVIIDLYDRKVIGWSMSKGLSAMETVIRAWLMATVKRPVTQELIFHSDRGIQYAYKEFAGILAKLS